MKQVISLWSNFGIDLGAGSAQFVIGAIDPNIIDASTLLGNIHCELNCATNPYGALGITSDIGSIGPLYRLEMGAYYFDAPAGSFGFDSNSYLNIDRSSQVAIDRASLSFGSYLIRDTKAITTAPEPSIAILLGSGLLLFGVARRKARV